MAEKDYYAVLGVSKSASAEEIKSAYKNLAKQFHPDVNKSHDAEEKFKQVQEAYSVLGDAEKRGQYDQFGSESFRGGAGFQGFSGFGGFEDVHFEDLFRGMDPFQEFFKQAGFGGARSRTGPVRGNDIEMELNLSLKEAALGTEKEIEFERVENCKRCGGSGAEGKSDIVNCASCKGTGYQEKTQRTPFGFFSSRTTCAKCGGAGKVNQHPCKECHGTGQTLNLKKLKVKIPAGIDAGQQLRIPTEGSHGTRGGRGGDVYLRVRIQKDPVFRRDGYDLFAEVPLSFPTAVLGGTIEVPTLDGNAKLHIPAGTQNGTIFKLRGKGIKALNKSDFGDEFVKTTIEVPQHASAKQKQLMEEFAKEEKKGGKLFGLI